MISSFDIYSRRPCSSCRALSIILHQLPSIAKNANLKKYKVNQAYSIGAVSENSAPPIQPEPFCEKKEDQPHRPGGASSCAIQISLLRIFYQFFLSPIPSTSNNNNNNSNNKKKQQQQQLQQLFRHQSIPILYLTLIIREAGQSSTTSFVIPSYLSYQTCATLHYLEPHALTTAWRHRTFGPSVISSRDKRIILIHRNESSIILHSSPLTAVLPSTLLLPSHPRATASSHPYITVAFAWSTSQRACAGPLLLSTPLPGTWRVQSNGLLHQHCLHCHSKSPSQKPRSI